MQTTYSFNKNRLNVFIPNTILELNLSYNTSENIIVNKRNFEVYAKSQSITITPNTIYNTWFC